jgi:CBS domain-containing protein
MRVRDLLRNKGSVVTIDANTDVARAVHLMMHHHVGGLPVVGVGGGVIGFVAEREIVKAVDANHDVKHSAVERIMRRPAPACTADDTLQDVMVRMTRDRLRHLVVLDGDRLIGVISVGDLVKHRLEQLETETGVLRDYVAAHRAST